MAIYEYTTKTIYTHTPKMEGVYLEPNVENAKKVAESDEPIYLGILNDVEQLNKARDFLGAIITVKENKERKEKYRKAWINTTYEKFKTLYNEGKADFVILGNTTVVCVTTTDRKRKVRMGKAVRSPEDMFDRKTGIAVAYARAMTLGVPNYI